MDHRIGSLRNYIDRICLSTRMRDQDVMIHILDNLTKEYDVSFGGMESRMMLDDSYSNKLTIGDS